MTSYAQMALKYSNMNNTVFMAELGEGFLRASINADEKDKRKLLDNFRSMINRQMYGIGTTKVKLGKVSVNKLVNKTKSSSRLLALGYDIILPIINATTGF